MTPKQKAEELYHKYYTTLLPNVRIRKGISIQHALIAVDEIISSIPTLPNDNNKLEKTNAIMYWVEVKQELEKL